MKEYITVWSVDNDGKLTFAYETKEPVVRCRDCRYFDGKCWCDSMENYVEPDGFCKWGEPIRNHLEPSGT